MTHWPQRGWRSGSSQEATTLAMRPTCWCVRRWSGSSKFLAKPVAAPWATHRSCVNRSRRPHWRWLRSRIIHGYDRVEHAIVLCTVRRDLPMLIVRLEAELRRFPLE